MLASLPPTSTAPARLGRTAATPTLATSALLADPISSETRKQPGCSLLQPVCRRRSLHVIQRLAQSAPLVDLVVFASAVALLHDRAAGGGQVERSTTYRRSRKRESAPL